jgi:hypothetical protein
MKSLLLLCSLFACTIINAQGIIATSSSKLRTITATGFNSFSPKLGINVDPTANLDVEGMPEPQMPLPSNIRFRNLPQTIDTMVLVKDADGYVKWRGISSFSSAGGATNAWLLGGNSVTAAQFIGTLNNDDMRFQTNSLKRMRLLSQGSLSIETSPGSNTSNDVANLLVGDGNSVNTGNSNLVSGWANTVNNTAATIIAGMQNTAANPSGAMISKSAALGWANTLENHNQYLVGAANKATQEYSGVLGTGMTVNNRGTWYLGGNAGTSLTNDLANSLAIGWGDIHTGLFDVNGLTLGTGTSNTTGGVDQATARIDVNGPAFNGFPSGVRFRDLPGGQGYALVVDAAGYVYQTKTQLHKPAGNEALEAEVKDLKNQLILLQQQVQAILNGNTRAAATGNNTMSIVPTPFRDKATVAYSIENYSDNAMLRVMDSKGLLLKTIPLRQQKGQVEVYQPAIAGGVLVFSIMVDGKTIISKQSIGM